MFFDIFIYMYSIKYYGDKMKYKNLNKFSLVAKSTAADYMLSKAITPRTTRVEFAQYCDFYELDLEEEKLNREEQFSQKFNW
jgi:hypothetical protein